MLDIILKDCVLCPRECNIDRTSGNKVYCNETDELVVARAALHMWEEPCISSEKVQILSFFRGVP